MASRWHRLADSHYGESPASGLALSWCRIQIHRLRQTASGRTYKVTTLRPRDGDSRQPERSDLADILRSATAVCIASRARPGAFNTAWSATHVLGGTAAVTCTAWSPPSGRRDASSYGPVPCRKTLDACSERVMGSG